MFINVNTPAVILYGYRIILMDRYPDPGAVSGQGLVNGVIDYFPDEMVEPFLSCVADIHGWSFSHGLKSVEYLYLLRTIIVVYFCHRKSFVKRKVEKLRCPERIARAAWA